MVDEWPRRAVVFTCCIVIVMTFGALLYGLFRSEVDNDKIFAILEHGFPMVLIAMLGLVKTNRGGSDG